MGNDNCRNFYKSKWWNREFYLGLYKASCLKGQYHEIFDDKFYSWISWFGRHFEKRIFPFLLTPAKSLGSDQTISNIANNTAFLCITHQYIGATNQIAPMYWCC